MDSKHLKKTSCFKKALIDTPLGEMVAVGYDEALVLLKFTDCRHLKRELERLPIVPGEARTLRSIEQELDEYFGGQRTEFNTPLALLGSPFQKRVWKELLRIPGGQTRSYQEIAKGIGKPAAYRAVANANGANPLTLIIPCHRVINTNGKLGGYGAGIERKQWLLNHERA